MWTITASKNPKALASIEQREISYVFEKETNEAGLSRRTTYRGSCIPAPVNCSMRMNKTPNSHAHRGSFLYGHKARASKVVPTANDRGFDIQSNLEGKIFG